MICRLYLHPMKSVFRIVALLEGLSYIGLLFVGVPMKYFANNDALVKGLGMPHGILFMAYLVMAFLIRDQMNWKGKSFIIVLLASIIPFGTFWVERKYFA